MRSDDIVISAKDLTKSYRLFAHPGDRVKQFLSLGLKKYHREFTALKDVSFDIKKGETVGIIGRNGSGKSTLLQLVCGILKPTTGTVQVNGRVSALLELGAGFNAEFTGRENVYFQGALMGFTRAQMEEKFDEIAAFADIGQFIDQPVRMYSSGMFVRLAFAVAIHVDPEILVVDEALAVGDAAFQQKCFARIHDIRARGGCILLVTHALEQVAHYCDRALLLDAGHLKAIGDTARTLARYLALLQQTPTEPTAATAIAAPAAADAFSRHPAYNPQEIRWGDRLASITDIAITQDDRSDPVNLIPGRAMQIRFRVEYHADIERPIYGLALKSRDGTIVFSTNSRELLASRPAPRQRLGDVVYPSFVFSPLLDCGDYTMSIGIASEQDGHIIPHDRRFDSIKLHIEKPRTVAGDVDMNPAFRLLDALL